MLIEQQLRDIIGGFADVTTESSGVYTISFTQEGKERLIVELAAFIKVREKEALKKVVEGIYRGVLDSIDKGTLEGD